MQIRKQKVTDSKRFRPRHRADKKTTLIISGNLIWTESINGERKKYFNTEPAWRAGRALGGGRAGRGHKGASAVDHHPAYHSCSCTIGGPPPSLSFLLLRHRTPPDTLADRQTQTHRQTDRQTRTDRHPWAASATVARVPADRLGQSYDGRSRLQVERQPLS